MTHLDAVGPDVVIVVAVVPGVGIAAHFGWLGAAVEASRRESICNSAERRLLVCKAVYMPQDLQKSNTRESQTKKELGRKYQEINVAFFSCLFLPSRIYLRPRLSSFLPK